MMQEEIFAFKPSTYCILYITFSDVRTLKQKKPGGMEGLWGIEPRSYELRAAKYTIWNSELCVKGSQPP